MHVSGRVVQMYFFRGCSMGVSKDMQEVQAVQDCANVKACEHVRASKSVQECANVQERASSAQRVHSAHGHLLLGKASVHALASPWYITTLDEQALAHHSNGGWAYLASLYAFGSPFESRRIRDRVMPHQSERADEARRRQRH